MVRKQGQIAFYPGDTISLAKQYRMICVEILYHLWKEILDLLERNTSLPLITGTLRWTVQRKSAASPLSDELTKGRVSYRLGQL